MELPWIESLLPYIGMVSAVVALAGSSIVNKMAISSGTSFYILSLYSNGFATLILFPAAYLVHRSNRPLLSFAVLLRIFFLASFGCFADISSFAGLSYSSPTLCTAMLILVPAFTYILAIIFGMEEANFRKFSTIAKSLGTVISIAGAFIVTFYSGPALLNTSLSSVSFTKPFLPSTQNWILGGFLFACSSLAVASWSILQASILKIYPAEMIVVAFYCLFVTIQSSVVTLIAERDVTAWRIETKIGLIAILYSAIINIAYRLNVTAWCIWKKGPFFVSLFKPLTVVVAVIVGVIFMKEVLYLGSVVGALVLIVGFYAVMWGKSKEGKIYKDTESSNYQDPLLQASTEEAKTAMGMENAAPYIGMVIVQLAQVGLMIAGKVAMSNGLSTFTFTFYSNALASLILLPVSLFIYRSNRPPLFLAFLYGFFLLGFLGFLVQILGYTGLMYSTASLSTTILNLIPGFTFVSAVIFRMEKFNYRSSTTLAKSTGTLVSIIGAVIVTLYQGPSIWGISSHSNDTLHILTSSSAWLIGGLLLTLDSIVSAIFIIAQAIVLKKCPAELLLMLFYSCFIAILSATTSLIVEKDLSSWSLNCRMRLLPIIYSAFFGNVFQVTIIMWCVRRKGPLFASVFHPLGVIFSIAMGIIFLGEALYLGSILGSVVVVVGFYGVMWGKAKEAKTNMEINKVESLGSSGKRVPLLLNNTIMRME